VDEEERLYNHFREIARQEMATIGHSFPDDQIRAELERIKKERDSKMISIPATTLERWEDVIEDITKRLNHMNKQLETIIRLLTENQD